MSGIIGEDVSRYYQKTLQEIRNDVDSTDTYIKGLALEALAIKIMGIIGLDFIKTRLKGSETGGAKVDVLLIQAGCYTPVGRCNVRIQVRFL